MLGSQTITTPAGFAKILCSAVFITGLDADFAAENIGYFTSDYDQRAKVTKREIDLANKMVRLTLPDGVVRTAKYVGDQGCVTFPLGDDFSGSTGPRRTIA